MATSFAILAALGSIASGCTPAQNAPPVIGADPDNVAPPSAATSSTPTPIDASPALLDPSLATEKAPDVFKAKFMTSKGDFTVTVHRLWAPVGADRFYNLVKIGFYDAERFFRVMDGFMCQWGINGDFAVNAKWHDANIADDPVTQSNKRGFVTFATSGKDSRTTQVFISAADNSNLDADGFAPFGTVTDGMAVVDSLYKSYGDGPPQGSGPDQARLQSEGNDYLKNSFPKLDWIKGARIVP